jgi:hypothetical protein
MRADLRSGSARKFLPDWPETSAKTWQNCVCTWWCSAALCNKKEKNILVNKSEINIPAYKLENN